MVREQICMCVYMFVIMSMFLHVYVCLCGRACLPRPCAAVCPLYEKPRTVCPRLSVHKLFVKKRQIKSS